MLHRGEIKPFSFEAKLKIMWCVCVTIKFSLRFAATQMTPRILQPSVNMGQCAHRILKILEVYFGSFWTISLAELQVQCEE